MALGYDSVGRLNEAEKSVKQANDLNGYNPPSSKLWLTQCRKNGKF